MVGPSSRRAVLGAGLASAMLSACGARTPDEILVLGDQANLTRAKVEAAGLLKNRPYAFRWANFAGAAPLFEAVMAGAVDTAPAGDTPVLAAAANGVPIKADELGPHGVTANVIHPGGTRTEKTTPEAEARIAAANTIGRIVDASEIAWLVTVLASPLSGAINGQTLAAGGTPTVIDY